LGSPLPNQSKNFLTGQQTILPINFIIFFIGHNQLE
jgi:hypothetical protein